MNGPATHVAPDEPELSMACSRGSITPLLDPQKTANPTGASLALGLTSMGLSLTQEEKLSS